MRITCLSCGESFDATQKQQQLITESTAKKMKLLMLPCGACGDTFPFHPGGKDRNSEIEIRPYRCPTVACTGYVSRIGDITEFDYGCGECGTTWKSQSDLFFDIQQIAVKFSWRKLAYAFDDGNISPIAPADEPADYEAKVRGEWADEV